MLAAETTGIGAVDSAVVWSLGLVAVAAAGALVVRAVRGVLRGARRLDELVEDWRGTPARPGVPARPGMLERMTAIEARTACMAECLDDVGARVSRIESEVRPNGGSSLRDAVNRVDRRTARMAPDNGG
jgi:hypothetical protein